MSSKTASRTLWEGAARQQVRTRAWQRNAPPARCRNNRLAEPSRVTPDPRHQGRGRSWGSTFRCSGRAARLRPGRRGDQGEEYGASGHRHLSASRPIFECPRNRVNSTNEALRAARGIPIPSPTGGGSHQSRRRWRPETRSRVARGVRQARETACIARGALRGVLAFVDKDRRSGHNACGIERSSARGTRHAARRTGAER